METFFLNKEIAQMMGSKYQQDAIADGSSLDQEWSWSEPFNGYPIVDGLPQIAAWQIGNFRFHNNWDWLMKAVDQIENNGFNVTINGNTCTIVDQTSKSNPLDYDFFEVVTADSKFEANYKAIVKFSMWWNQKS
jgi:hypothetical protein